MTPFEGMPPKELFHFVYSVLALLVGAACILCAMRLLLRKLQNARYRFKIGKRISLDALNPALFFALMGFLIIWSTRL